MMVIIEPTVSAGEVIFMPDVRLRFFSTEVAQSKQLFLAKLFKLFRRGLELLVDCAA